MKKTICRNGQSGFTIIELMISTTIFSLVLMLCLAGIMQITKMYYRGVTQIRVQEKARVVADEIAESIRYTSSNALVTTQPITFADPIVVGPDVAVGNDDTNYFCVGSKRYTYAVDRQLKESPVSGTKQKKHVLWVDTVNGECSNSPVDLNAQPTNGQELLGENMRLTRFEVVSGANDTFTIYVGVAYGDDDLLQISSDGKYKTCEGAFAGVEFCATSAISLTVEKRL